MLACRRPSTLLRQLRPSSRAGFQTFPASAGARQTTPRTTLKVDPQPHAYHPQPPQSPKPQPKPIHSPGNTHPRPPRARNPVPPEPSPSKKLVNAPLAGALALALVFGYFASVSLFKPASSAADALAADGHVPADPLYHRSPGPSDPRDVPTGRPTSLAGISAAEFDRELDREEYRTGVAKLRKMLAGRAAGHVLEVAVGTGRNFDLYEWDTLAGVSPAVAAPTGAAAAAAAPASKGKKDQQPAEEPKSQMLSFTGVDIATDMLDVAAAKLKAIPALSEAVKDPSITVLRDRKDEVAAGAIEYLSGAIRLVKANALSFIPPPPSTASSSHPSPAQAKTRKPPPPSAPAPDAKYDTVIQTFGLCSVSSPQEILASLASLVKPDTGRILLLEHGRGTWSLVNWWLDRHAPEHFRKYGCWWNRDLEAVVRDAARKSAAAADKGTGGRRLEVVKVERPGYQGGTVLWIELRVVEG